MYTLLPEQQIKNLEKEYYIRLAILALLSLSVSIWIGIGSLLPSYIISVVQERTAESQSQQIQKGTETADNANISTEVAASNADILLVKNAQDNFLFSAIIEDVAGHHMTGVTLTDFEMTRAPTSDDPDQVNVLIRGNAGTREELVAFQHLLSGDTQLSPVDLPVSILTKSHDIPFSLSFTAL